MNDPVSCSSTDSNKEITKEIRFAVVMYGGISLAIYMNGIAQELLGMVKATAPNAGKEVASQTSRTEQQAMSGKQETSSVYRKIADYLSNETSSAFRHKFVVDIISGTSAGGINGVFLAKSLVRGLDNLDALENIWLDEGDIDKLLNDSNSQPHLFPSKEPKTSLFNSQRMFAKLFEAFTKMEDKGTDFPHIESMDLFVTATDLRGIQVPLALSGGTAYEHIYKHVFPFRYREKSSSWEKTPNHFTKEFDPMLAFASRCTSSIPPAFEPVKIHETLKSVKSDWKTLFFKKYENIDPGAGAEQGVPELEEREFSDGGYLDNKPFGHAINAIHARQASCPIERKLLFIDPSPEMKDGQETNKEISFVKNGLLAFSMPRYETIREELNSLKQRNDWIKKVQHILDEKMFDQNKDELEKHIKNEFKNYALKSSADNREELSKNLFSFVWDEKYETIKEFWRYIANPKNEKREEKKDFNSMLNELGGAYTAYHYTRLNLLTDQLALMIAKASMVDEDFDIFNNVREYVKLWRIDYCTSFMSSNPKSTMMMAEKNFFREFDLDFRIRRLSFFRKNLEKAISEQKIVYLCFDKNNQTDYATEFDWNDNFIRSIRIFYDDIVKDNLKSYYILKERLLASGDENYLFSEWSLLSGDFSKEKIKSFFAQEYKHDSESGIAFKRLMERLGTFIKDGNNVLHHATLKASESIALAISKLSLDYPEIAGRLRLMYDYGYDLYDATTFQLFAGNDYGEGNVVDIYRISSADATTLWNEAETQKPKLAGIALGGFGGFLDRKWRRNDIMWGRLDAAEIIINALLPDLLVEKEKQLSSGEEREKLVRTEERKKKRQELITEVQEIIITETLDEWIAELESPKFSSQKDQDQCKTLYKIKTSMTTSSKGVGSGEPLWKKTFQENYDVERELEPEQGLRRLGRGAGVLSSMVERLDSGKGMLNKVGGYLKTLNWILLGMLDFSTPKTILGALSGYWLQLFMLASIAMIGLGFFFNIENVTFFGGALLAIDIVVLVVRRLLETHIHKVTGNPRLEWVLRLLLVLLLLVILLGLIPFYNIFMHHWSGFVSKLWNAYKEGILFFQ